MRFISQKEYLVMKKSWIKPELIVLVRNTSDENILKKKASCKLSSSPHSTIDISNGGHYYRACLQKNKNCKQCKDLSS